jgi:hypothetical protein
LPTPTLDRPAPALRAALAIDFAAPVRVADDGFAVNRLAHLDP